MNKNKEILILLKEYPKITQRKISKKLGISLGKVNSMIKELINKNLLEIKNGYILTNLGEEYMNKNYNITTAVILGAGASKDFNFPNGFISIENETLIERSIRILEELKFEKIYIVTGFKNEYYLNNLKNNNIIFINNDEYEKYSSYYSLLKMKSIINEDFLLLDSDIIYEKKAIQKMINDKRKDIVLISSETGSKDEAYVEIKDETLVNISKDKGELKKIDGEMLGITKISKETFKRICQLKVENCYYSYEYSISEISKEIEIGTLKINELIWGEIDNKFQLEKVMNEIYPRIKRNESLEKINEVENILMNILDIDKIDIDNIEVLGGMTNKNYLVEIKGKKYVTRIPGLGTENMIDRYFEKINAEKSALIGVDKKLVYFSEKTGIKISEYILGAETLNPETSKKNKNLKLVAELLKKLHESNEKFDNIFDVFKEIEKYEKFIKNRKLLEEKYIDYYKNREKILNLKNKLIENNFKYACSHNDTVPENFIKDNKGNIFLIDWEYSGMNDAMWDLAAFSLESKFSENDEKAFVNFYFNDNVSIENLNKIEIFKILQDFLWSIWTVLKEERGDNFGDYGINRYLRAIERLNIIIGV